MPIKTFRGLIADGNQDTVLLHTNDGTTGYKIKKFQLMPASPGAANSEHTVKIYSILQTAVDATVDFSSQDLLAAAFITNATDSHYYGGWDAIIIDNITFNQDIYITHSDIKSNEACNYYIELEQVKLDLNENTVATLKDIRNQA